ncbi:hypothetical protein KP509_18G083600 [Ceratopteris richardii]|uniref:Uncharacterized protein n=1 Tax=Ceratopteris richardii TaxID=49495 RepID=A0A8T2STE1_CERRI|nr:hypothetical protein KP509_18G083600 [Ceratopteris richardii]
MDTGIYSFTSIALSPHAYYRSMMHILVLAIAIAAAVSAESGVLPHPGARGDPHFTGWDGVNFDFTGQPGGVYCVISDELFHMNMKLCGRMKPLAAGKFRQQTWIKELGIMYRGHRILMVARDGADVSHRSSFMRSIEVDEKNVTLTNVKDAFRSTDNGVTISYEKKENRGVQQFDVYKIILGYGNEEVVLLVNAGPEVPEEREKDQDAFVHLSVEIAGGQPDFWTGGVHGILGQTLLNARGKARLRGDGSYKTQWNALLTQMQVEGPNGDGYLDGNASDYLSSGILYSDCHFSRFNPNLASSDFSPPFVTVSSGYARRLLPGFSFYTAL